MGDVNDARGQVVKNISLNNEDLIIMSYSSFKYRDFFGGNTVMVIVPHQDDEINVAGATIYGAIEEGLDVILVYVTNGDYQYKADIRYKEVIKMAKIMHLPLENIHFLGFPDGYGKEFLSNRESIVTHHAGFSQTHGACNIKDYASKYMGRSLDYTYTNIVLALEDIILRFKPNAIIAVDHDIHVDHKLTSIAVEEAIGIILKKQVTYKPKVLKSFAYDTNFESINDYYDNHLESTVQNRQWIKDKRWSTNNPMLLWADRIRIPVPQACRNTVLIENPIFKALGSHMSQSSYKHGPKLINGDQVFWERRTDNVALHATITATSGDCSKLNDFLRYDVRDVTKNIASSTEYAWIPDTKDNKPTITISFNKPTTIERIDWFENVWFESDELNGLQGVTIKTSNGLEVNVPQYSYPLFEDCPYMKTYVFEHPIVVEWIAMTVTKAKEGIAGISEIEIYSFNESKPTFCHIVANQQFAYDWTIYRRESLPSIYVYYDSMLDKTDMEFSIDGNSIKRDFMMEYIPIMIQHGPVNIRYGNDTIYHEMIIKKGTITDFIRKECLKVYNKFMFVLHKIKYRIGFNLAQKYRYKGF